MIEPTKVDTGRLVVYRPWPDCPPSEWEYGKITSFNENYVFVLYDGDTNPKATDRQDLGYQGEDYDLR